MNRRSFLKLVTGASTGASIASALNSSIKAEEAPNWRNNPDPMQRLLGLAAEIRSTLQRELRIAKRSGKVPIVCFGESHSNKVDFFFEALTATILDELLKTSNPRNSVTLCTEQPVNTNKILTTDYYLNLDSIVPLVKNADEIAKTGQAANGIGMVALTACLAKRSKITGLLLLDDNKKHQSFPDDDSLYYILSGGLIESRDRLESVKSTWGRPNNDLEIIGADKIEHNFTSGGNNVAMAVIGKYHLKGFYDLLKAKGKFHVIAFAAKDPDDKKVDILELPKDDKGLRVIAYKLKPSDDFAIANVTAPNGKTYSKAEAVEADCSYLEAKRDFFFSANVTDVNIAVTLEGSFNELAQLAITISKRSKSVSSVAK